MRTASDTLTRTAPETITEAALAERWYCSTRTLKRRREAGLAPPWFRVGRRVLYRLADVDEFETAGRDIHGGADANS